MRGKISPIFWVLPVVWLLGVAAAAARGLVHNHASHTDPALFVYETETVLIVCGLMTVETLLLMAIYRPATYAYSWGRALLALLVALSFLALGAIGSMHAPPAWGAMALWQLVQFGAALVLSVGSVLGAVMKRRAPDQ